MVSSNQFALWPLLNLLVNRVLTNQKYVCVSMTSLNENKIPSLFRSMHSAVSHNVKRFRIRNLNQVFWDMNKKVISNRFKWWNMLLTCCWLSIFIAIHSKLWQKCLIRFAFLNEYVTLSSSELLHSTYAQLPPSKESETPFIHYLISILVLCVSSSSSCMKIYIGYTQAVAFIISVLCSCIRLNINNH